MSAQSDLVHMFNGIPFSTRASIELLQSLDSFEVRADDLLLASYPKSGTHWLTEILKHLYHSQQAANGGKSMMLTTSIEFGDPFKFEELKNLPSLRLIPTHLNYRMLPVQFKTKKCKMIYIIRNPKDTAVSFYHYYRENANLPKIKKWATFLEMFMKGEVVCGSWWHHILSWEEHMNDDNVLILYYESMKKDLLKSIEQICNFLGISVTDQQMREISRRSSFKEMKEEAQRENPAPDHTVCVLTSNRQLVFRKGTVGDWKNYFTSEQNKHFEEQFRSRMNSSELAKSIIYES